MIQFSYWIILLIIVGIAIFAVQNSSAPQVEMKFLLWSYKTSLIYTLLGSVLLGVIITLFFWIPRAIRSSIQMRELKKKIETFEITSVNTIKE